MLKLVPAIVIFASTAAFAQSGTQCNEHGAIVTLDDGTVYYMGKNCDAAREGGGTGKWWLTASAFAIEINGESRLLPFEVDCELPACWNNG